MTPTTINTSDTDTAREKILRLIKVILESGSPVELPATGYSMFRTIRPGDKVVVKPFTDEALPKSGGVVVNENNKMLVMHRLVEIRVISGCEALFISRGDFAIEQDKP